LDVFRDGDLYLKAMAIGEGFDGHQIAIAVDPASL
jgi:hypothetical protein